MADFFGGKILPKNGENECHAGVIPKSRQIIPTIRPMPARCQLFNVAAGLCILRKNSTPSERINPAIVHNGIDTMLIPKPPYNLLDIVL